MRRIPLVSAAAVTALLLAGCAAQPTQQGSDSAGLQVARMADLAGVVFGLEWGVVDPLDDSSCVIGDQGNSGVRWRTELGSGAWPSASRAAIDQIVENWARIGIAAEVTERGTPFEAGTFGTAVVEAQLGASEAGTPSVDISFEASYSGGFLILTSECLPGTLSDDGS